MARDVIALDFDGNLVKIMIGNNKVIKYNDIIELPIDSIDSNDSANINGAVSTLSTYFMKNGIKEKDVIISIHESDVVVRHIEVPIMDDKSIKNSITYEINQYLPQSGKNHYIDYEIIDKIDDGTKKLYKLMVAALPREKVDKYVQIISKINLRLLSVNIAPNTVAACFESLAKLDKNKTNIGIIDVGNSSLSISILDNGKLFIERNIPFGILNFVNDVMEKRGINKSRAMEYLFNTFSFDNSYEYDESEDKFRKDFDNVLSSFSKVIQFYATGRANKRLDKIYIIGSGSKIRGLNNYISDYFDAETEIIQSEKQLVLNVKFTGKVNMTDFVNTTGLLCKEYTTSLNLMPNAVKKSTKFANPNMKFIIPAAALVIILAASYVVPSLYLVKLKSDEDKLRVQIQQGQSVIKDNVKLKADVSKYQQRADAVTQINNSKTSIVSRFNDLKKLVPSDIVTTIASYTNDTFTLTFNTTNYNSINEFHANIEENSKKYSKLLMGGITFDKTKNAYSSTVTVTCINDTSANGKTTDGKTNDTSTTKK